MAAQGVVNAFYAGETGKVVLTAALFAIALKLPSVNFLTLLAGYAAVLSVFWFALFYWRD
jgi:ATP synthase protein I